MHRPLFALWMLVLTIGPAAAQMSIGIGINVPAYPQLVRVPGYPVYYAPQMNTNYFFYDGMYWVYQRDNWYASSWYNGPWGLVRPEVVPLFVLRVPVRYYRQPPTYFRGWSGNAPPRWGAHWGNDWEQHRSGWDQWNHGAAPAPAPLPEYQRQYSGSRYPRVEQQQVIQTQNYRYQPRDEVVQQHYQAQRAQVAPAQVIPQQRPTAVQAPPQPRPATVQVPPPQRPANLQPPPQQGAQQQRSQQQGSAQREPQAPRVQGQQGAPAVQQPKQQGAAQREQQVPKGQAADRGSQGKGAAPDQKQGQGQGKSQGQGQDKGQGKGQGQGKGEPQQGGDHKP